jgi:hypothetical protein
MAITVTTKIRHGAEEFAPATTAKYIAGFVPSFVAPLLTIGCVLYHPAKKK